MVVATLSLAAAAAWWWLPRLCPGFVVAHSPWAGPVFRSAQALGTMHGQGLADLVGPWMNAGDAADRRLQVACLMASSRDREIRRAAAFMLDVAQPGPWPPAVLRILIAHLDSDPDQEVRIMMASALASDPDAEANRHLHEAMQDADQAVASQAAQAWGTSSSRGHGATWGDITVAFADDHPYIRAAAITAIGYRRDAAAQALYDQALADPDDVVRIPALAVLMQVDDRSHVAGLLGCLERADRSVVEYAAAVLRDERTPPVHAALLTIVRDALRPVAPVVVELFLNGCGPADVPLLVGLLAASGPEVRQKTLWTIRRLTPYGD